MNHEYVAQFDADRPLSREEMAAAWWNQTVRDGAGRPKSKGEDLVDDLVYLGETIPGFTSPFTGEPWTRKELAGEFEAEDHAGPQAHEILVDMHLSPSWPETHNRWMQLFREFVAAKAYKARAEIMEAA